MKPDIFTLEQMAERRRSIAGKNETVALVMGSFSMLQPGNLSVIVNAFKRTSHVFVLVEPGYGAKKQDKGSAERVELAAFIRYVSAACKAPWRESELEKLRPYVMFDCLPQPDPSALRVAARAAADEIVDIPALAGCFTTDILQAVRSGRTPVNIPGIYGKNVLEHPAGTSAVPRDKGKKLVTVNGCFDILHIGHLRMLAASRGMGDELIVLVNDDDSVRKYKGGGRPVFPIYFRLAALNALRPVSKAYAFSGDNPLDLLTDIRPDIHVKGGSYEPERVRAENELVRTWGGRLEFCPMVQGYSTTRIIQSNQG